MWETLEEEEALGCSEAKKRKHAGPQIVALISLLSFCDHFCGPAARCVASVACKSENFKKLVACRPVVCHYGCESLLQSKQNKVLEISARILNLVPIILSRSPTCKSGQTHISDILLLVQLVI